MSWWNSNWNMLEQETIDSIHMQDVKEKSEKFTRWACDCEESVVGDETWLHCCEWHEGFDAGAERVKEFFISK